MSEPSQTLNSADQGDVILARILEEITQEVEAGQRVDAAKYETQYPQYAQRIRDLVPAAEALGELGLSIISSPRSSRKPPHASFGVSGTLGDFRILREIGRGGMGVVYEAEQVSLGRPLALKVLPFAATLDPRQLPAVPQRGSGRRDPETSPYRRHPFGRLRAWRVLLRHGVDRGADAGSDDRRPAQSAGEKTMDQSPATAAPLARERAENAAPSAPESPTPVLVPAKPDPPSPAADTHGEAIEAGSTKPSPRAAARFRSAAQLALQAAEALEHAHHSGVVHRDIKPSNLMVDACGQLWITDFGLAMIQGDPALTLTGDILGTLRYMSPEQALGNRREMDHRTDIYSLGVTLYELLALQPAFGGDDRKRLIRQLVEEEPPPPRSVNPAIPRDLETIVLKAMAKEPSQRYAVAREFADDLRRFLADEPIRARRPSLADRAAKWAWRHRPLIWSAVILLVLSTIGSVISTLLIAGGI